MKVPRLVLVSKKGNKEKVENYRSNNKIFTPGIIKKILRWFSAISVRHLTLYRMIS